jgi:uncharacterized protein YfdQ (DUF2303 family)
MNIEELAQSVLTRLMVGAVNESTGALALPEGWKIESVEHLLERPRVLRQTVKVCRLPDFLAYTLRFGGADTLVSISPDLHIGKPLAVAHIDYHQPPVNGVGDDALPSWDQHLLSYVPRSSIGYTMLTAIDGKLMDQSAFAEQLRDLTKLCTSHAGADLLEIVRTLTLTSKGAFQSFDDALTGSVAFRYELDVAATAGTQQRKLEVPSALRFTLPVIDGAEPQEITAELLYRVPKQAGGAVQMGLRLPDRVWIERAMVEKLAADIAGALPGLTIVGEVQ